MDVTVESVSFDDFETAPKNQSMATFQKYHTHCENPDDIPIVEYLDRNFNIYQSFISNKACDLEDNTISDKLKGVGSPNYPNISM